MPIHGSSSIHPPPAVGPQGNTGGIGAIGPMGNLGPSGVTGFTGPTGTFVESSYYKENDPNLYLILSDGTEIKIKGLGGATGEAGDAKGKTSDIGFPILKEVVAGETFEFKGFTAEGSLVVYGDANVLGISGDKRFELGSTAESLSEYRFLYLSTRSTADVSGLTYDYQDQSMIFGHGRTGNRWTYSPEENIINVGPVEYDETVNIYGTEEWTSGPQAGQGVGIQLAVTAGSVYEIETPIGIAGFTGNFPAMGENDIEGELLNFTLMVKGNDIWDWPNNVYVDPKDRFFTCGTDIINIMTLDGEYFYATFTARGYEVTGCESVYGLGSCCYIDDNGLQRCNDFVAESECELKNQSYWNPLSTCEDNCGQQGEGVCCSAGGNWGMWPDERVCNNGIGPAECNYFMGNHYTYFYYTDNIIPGLPQVLLSEPIPIDCNLTYPTGQPINDTLCVGSCDSPSACCKGGSCIGDSVGSSELGMISPGICKYVYGGTSIPNQVCGNFDCCDYIEHLGACCKTSNETCNEKTWSECNAEGGVFMGPNTVCTGPDAVNCCFGDVGACCWLGQCQYPTYLQDCEPPKTFFPNQTCQDVSDEDACSPECVVDADCGQPDILCCVNNICVGCPIQQDELGCCCLCNEQSYTTTFEQCQLMGGEWLEGKKCGDVITVPDSDKWACCIECNTPCQGEFGQSFHCVEVGSLEECSAAADELSDPVIGIGDGTSCEVHNYFGPEYGDEYGDEPPYRYFTDCAQMTRYAIATNNLTLCGEDTDMGTCCCACGDCDNYAGANICTTTSRTACFELPDCARPCVGGVPACGGEPIFYSFYNPDGSPNEDFRTCCTRGIDCAEDATGSCCYESSFSEPGEPCVRLDNSNCIECGGGTCTEIPLDCSAPGVTCQQCCAYTVLGEYRCGCGVDVGDDAVIVYCRGMCCNDEVFIPNCISSEDCDQFCDNFGGGI